MVKLDGPPHLCKTDEVGELCINSGVTGREFWGLSGLTNNVFKVQALGSVEEGRKPITVDPAPAVDQGAAAANANAESFFVRSGLLGFLGPVCTKLFLEGFPRKKRSNNFPNISSFVLLWALFTNFLTLLRRSTTLLLYSVSVSLSKKINRPNPSNRLYFQPCNP